MREDLLAKLRCEKETNRWWKQGQVSWEKQRDTAWMCREGIREDEA